MHFVSNLQVNICFENPVYHVVLKLLMPCTSAKGQARGFNTQSGHVKALYLLLRTQVGTCYLWDRTGLAVPESV